MTACLRCTTRAGMQPGLDFHRRRGGMKPATDPRDAAARAAALVGLVSDPGRFGRIRSVNPHEVPEPARSLLDHPSHMTVAMERFHGGEVRLRVVKTLDAGGGDGTPPAGYVREILLENQAGRIIQYGIVRIELTSLDAATVRAIRDAQRPLGRILIEAGVLRDVRDVALLEVVPGPWLAEVLRPAEGIVGGPPLYGRVADIQLNGRPAVELLEIVVPA